jgi:hypothetical protein
VIVTLAVLGLIGLILSTIFTIKLGDVRREP